MGEAPVRLQRRMGARLAGRRIVVTRAREQAQDLARALEAHGATVILAPVIRIEPAADLEPLRSALARLATYRWIVFTSQNTVSIVLDQIPQSGSGLGATSVAAVGTATADALARRGVTAAAVPEEFVGEALADAIAARDPALSGARVLIPSAQDAREALADGLRRHGAKVESIAVYRTVTAATDLGPVAADLLAGRIDAVTFTSSSTVRAFVELAGRDAATSSRYVAAAIGPVTATTARALGLKDVIVAEPHTADGLVAALSARLA